MDSLRGTREAGTDPLDSVQGTREAPRRQERTIWTAWETPGRHQGGRKGSIGQPVEAPGRHQGGMKEAGKTIWTAGEAPGKPERTNWMGHVNVRLHVRHEVDASW